MIREFIVISIVFSGFLFMTFHVVSLKDQVVSLELDKAEIRRNLDDLASYTKTLNYQVDVLLSSLK